MLDATLAIEPTPAQIIAKNLEHFGQHARGYDEGCVAAKWVGPQVLARKLQLYSDLQGEIRGLDIATGTGGQAAAIKDINPEAHFVGTDGRQEMIDIALEKGAIDQGIAITFVDFPNAPFVREQFNLVTFTGGADFAQDLEPIIDTFTRASEPGTILALTYEPTNNPQPGAKTNFRHDTAHLHEDLRQRGWTVLEDQPFDAWQKGKARTQVSNNLLIARLDNAL
jgi:ubiquinone/menaquinone biosynthesis C-methylase UbiE